MKWPKTISPFDVVIIPSLSKNNKENLQKAEKIYQDLKKQNVESYYDLNLNSETSRYIFRILAVKTILKIQKNMVLTLEAKIYISL